MTSCPATSWHDTLALVIISVAFMYFVFRMATGR